MDLSEQEGRLSPVQRRAEAGAGAEGDVHRAAAHGLSGGGGAMPHLEAIQRSFGRHDVSNVQAHTGGVAREASEAMGASAYASGDHVAFGAAPSLHTAAHEAAHVVQQRAGVSLSGGVGQAGDAHEQQADQVADAVVAGRSAEGLLDKGGSGGGAAVQRQPRIQFKRKGFKRGTELTEHKSSSKEAKEDYIKLMHGSDRWRARELQRILTTRKQSGNQLFFHLQTLVMGSTTLAAAYNSETGGDLFNDLDATGLSAEQLAYLKTCITDGKPSFEHKLRLALGLTTKTKGDKKEVEILVDEHPAPVGEKLAAVKLLQPEIEGLFKGGRRFDSFVKRLEYGVVKEAGKGPGQTDEEHGEELMQLADAELASLIHSSVKKIKVVVNTPATKVEKKAFKADLTAWIQRHSRAEHFYVTGPSSKTQAAFAEYTSDTKIIDKFRWTTKQVNYLNQRILKSAPVGDEFFTDDDRETSQLGEKAKEEREEQKSEHGTNIGLLRTHLDSKIGKHEDETSGTNSKKLPKLIKKLSDSEKDWFLRSYLTPREQMEWDDPDFDDKARLALRDKAIAAVEVELKRAGLGHGGKLTELREKLVKKLDYSYAKTPTLKRIKDLATSEVPHQTNPSYRGPKLFGLVRKLRGDEYAGLRGNKKVMDAIQAGVDTKYWERIQAVLGISDTNDKVDGVTGKGVVDLHREQGPSGERKNTRDEARQLGADEAELKPSHWGMCLTATLKESKLKKSSEVNSLVTRAFMAGKRRERMTKGGRDVELSGTQQLGPMTAKEFMAAVESTISPAAMKVFESEKKLAHALTALRNGTRPTVDEQIEDAIYRNKAKMTSGDKAQAGNIEKTFEDLQGADLLEEWSNIREFRVYKARYEQLKGQQKKDARQKLRTFVIDIRKDRHDQLIGMLSPKSLGKTLKSLRMRLANAMEKDPEVITTLAEAGFANDELSQAKTRTLALTDDQKLRSTGAQYNTLPKGSTKVLKGVKTSSKSAQTKESMSELLGGHRKVESELSQGKDRKQVVEGNIEDIKDKQEELTRRGVAFDKMQKKFNRAMTWIAKAVVTALIGAAMGALTVLTGGVGGVLAVALGVVMVTAKTLVLKAVQAGLEGDRFNTTKAISDLAFKAILGAATGALAEFAVPEVLELVGQGITNPGANIGFESLTNATPTDTNGIATKAAIEFALGKGAKGLLRTAYKEVTATGYHNPAARAMIMMEMGGLILSGGSTVASEVFAPVNAQLQAGTLVGETTGNTVVDQGLEKTAQFGGQQTQKVLGYGMKAQKYAPKLRKALAKLYAKKNQHGEDREDNLGALIPNVIAGAKLALESIDERIQDAISNGGDYGAIAMQKSEIIDLLKELEEEYAVWQEEQEQKRGLDDEVSSAGVASVPLILKAIELDEKVHGPA